MIPYKFAVPSAVLLITALLLSAHAQFDGGGRRWFRRSYEIRDPKQIREKEEMQNALDPAFKEDVFTFARLRFDADRDYRFGGGRLWDDDTPEADLNLIFRLYQVTSLKV